MLVLNDIAVVLQKCIIRRLMKMTLEKLEKVYKTLEMIMNPFRKTAEDYRREEREILKTQLITAFVLVLGCPAIMLVLVMVIRLLQGLPVFPPEWK